MINSTYKIKNERKGRNAGNVSGALCPLLLDLICSKEVAVSNMQQRLGRTAKWWRQRHYRINLKNWLPTM